MEFCENSDESPMNNQIKFRQIILKGNNKLEQQFNVLNVKKGVLLRNQFANLGVSTIQIKDKNLMES